MISQKIEYRQIGIYKDPVSSIDGCPKCGYKDEVKYYNVKFTPFEDKDNGFTVQCIDEGMTGAISEGDTESEATKNIIEAIQLMEECKND